MNTLNAASRSVSLNPSSTAGTNRRKSGTSASVPFRDSLKMLGQSASQEVRNAWEQAQAETGTNGVAMNSDGMLTQITSLFAMSFENAYVNGSRDIFGSTNKSAEAAVWRALHRLGTPQNIEAEKEKQFYESFLRNLTSDSTSVTESAAAHNHFVINMSDREEYLFNHWYPQTGQNLHIKYDESSTEENPVMYAEGTDINGNSFQQKIYLNDINLNSATFVEIAALNTHLSETGKFQSQLGGFSSAMTQLASNNITEKTNIAMFYQDNISKYQAAGYRTTAQRYREELEQFLSYVQMNSRKTTGEENQFNWEADGTGELTEEQIAYLKEKYDMNHLTYEQCLKLMAELTQMNSLSGEDVKNQLVRQVPLTDHFITAGWTDLETMNNLHYTDYFQYLQTETKNYQSLLDMLFTGNHNLKGNDIQVMYDYYQDRILRNEKISKIFSLLL